jgi:iron complex transport system substrate-binding protein
VRIVSVLPSATEIVCALGAGQELVGRSAECDFPPEVARVPVVMRPRTRDFDRPSGEIDRRVQRARAAGESLYELDVAQLRELRPDVLLTQDLCGVCSVTEEEAAEACARAGVRPRIVALTPRTLGDVWDSVRTVAEAIGRTPEGTALSDGLRRRAAPSPRTIPARVAIVEWLDPPILAGLWTPAIVAAAGGVSVGPAEGEVGQRTSWAELAARGPQLVVLSPCSFPVARTRAEVARSGVFEEAARTLRGRRTYLADEAYFSRPGPRLADGVELVRALLRGEPGRCPMPVEPWNPATAEVAR